MTTFVLKKGHKLGAVAAKEGIRFALQNVLAHSTGPDSYLTATDGMMLATVTVEGSVAKPTLLPAAVATSNGKDVTIRLADQQVFALADARQGQKVFELPDQDGVFPGFGSCFPQTLDGYVPLTLDSKRLKAVLDAVSAQGTVTLYVGDPKTAVVLLGDTGEDQLPSGLGLLMPLGLDDAMLARNREYYSRHATNLPKSSIRFEQKTAPAPAASDGEQQTVAASAPFPASDGQERGDEC